MRRSSVDQSTFDPTPEEVAKVERAKPTQHPLCIKCKNLKRIEVWETVSHRINEAFLKLNDLLVYQVGEFSREEVGRLRTMHELLCRASKARYCEPCVTGTVAYVLETVAKLRVREPK